MSSKPRNNVCRDHSQDKGWECFNPSQASQYLYCRSHTVNQVQSCPGSTASASSMPSRALSDLGEARHGASQPHPRFQATQTPHGRFLWWRGTHSSPSDQDQEPCQVWPSQAQALGCMEEKTPTECQRGFQRQDQEGEGGEVGQGGEGGEGVRV